MNKKHFEDKSKRLFGIFHVKIDSMDTRYDEIEIIDRRDPNFGKIKVMLTLGDFRGMADYQERLAIAIEAVVPESKRLGQSTSQ